MGEECSVFHCSLRPAENQSEKILFPSDCAAVGNHRKSKFRRSPARIDDPQSCSTLLDVEPTVQRHQRWFYFQENSNYFNTHSRVLADFWFLFVQPPNSSSPPLPSEPSRPEDVGAAGESRATQIRAIGSEQTSCVQVWTFRSLFLFQGEALTSPVRSAGTVPSSCRRYFKKWGTM